ncbi:hypothetical protein D3C81_1975700 [compost metagenome]
MHAGLAGGLDHRVAVYFTEAGDVLGDGALEQLHILRQVAQPGAEFFLVPLEHVGAVQAYLAGLGRPDADQQAGKGRLA